MSRIDTDRAKGDSADYEGDGEKTPTPPNPAAEDWTPTWGAPGENISEWCGDLHVGRPEAFVSVAAPEAPAGSVGRVFRARMENENDKWRDSSGWRAEGVGPTDPPSDRPVRYQWATFFPDTYPADPSGELWQLFTQWHQQDEDFVGDSPPIAFIVSGENLCLDLRYVDPNGDLDSSLPLPAPPEPVIFTSTPEAGFRNRWHYFLVEIVWSLNGSIRVWHSNTGFDDLTGDPVYERTGFQAAFPTRSSLEAGTPVPGSVYLKAGLYREEGTVDPNFVVYHDQFERKANPPDGVGCPTE